MSRWYGFDTRDMYRLYGFDIWEMSRWYSYIRIVWFNHSGDLKMVWLCYSVSMEILVIVWICPSGGVKMVWFWGFSGRWFSLVFALGRRKIHPQTLYASRVSTTSPESNNTSPERISLRRHKNKLASSKLRFRVRNYDPLTYSLTDGGEV